MGKPRVRIEPQSEMRPRRERHPINHRMLYPWEGTFALYAQKFTNRNAWRVRRILPDRDDVMQECALVFARCVDRYATKVNNQAWMMGLYKVSLANHFHSLASRSTAVGEGSDAYTHDALVWSQEATESHWGAASVMVSDASAEVLHVLRFLADAPQEMLAIALGDDAAEPDAICRRLKRLCGLPLRVDLLGELRALIAD